MPDITLLLRAAREQFQDEMELLTDECMHQVLGRVGTLESLSEPVLDGAAAGSREKLIDKLLSDDFLSAISETCQVEKPDRQLIAHNLRAAAEPLHVDIPEPVMQIRPRAWALAAGLGAILGVLFTPSMLRALVHAQYGEAGILLGGPLGAIIGVVFIGFLGRHKVLLRLFQAALGGATGAEVTVMFLGATSPWRAVKNYLTGRLPGDGLISKIRRIVLYITGIIVLQCAVPTAFYGQDQLQQNIRSAIHAWLRHHADLLILLVLYAALVPHKETDENEYALPPQMLRVLEKLTQSAKNSDRDGVVSTAEELVQEFNNAGFDIQPDDAGRVYEETLLQHYEVIGLIKPGDPYRVLEKPVLQNGTVALKGKITRKRET